MASFVRGLLLVGCLALVSCFKIGNESGACKTGETCVCDLIGNCLRSCPDGMCKFECRGTGNCIFSCEGGGCQAVCLNTGTCQLECPSNDCSIDCRGTGVCRLEGTPDMSATPRPDLSGSDLTTPGDMTELVDGADVD
jgi:hypothetical protein